MQKKTQSSNSELGLPMYSHDKIDRSLRAESRRALIKTAGKKKFGRP